MRAGAPAERTLMVNRVALAVPPVRSGDLQGGAGEALGERPEPSRIRFRGDAIRLRLAPARQGPRVASQRGAVALVRGPLEQPCPDGPVCDVWAEQNGDLLQGSVPGDLGSMGPTPAARTSARAMRFSRSSNEATSCMSARTPMANFSPPMRMAWTSLDTCSGRASKVVCSTRKSAVSSRVIKGSSGRRMRRRPRRGVPAAPWRRSP